jgi:type IX secretion system PorP/SprF family membrane protein
MKYRLPLSSKNSAWLFVVVLSLVASIRANAQYEPLFTQYMFNETFINPAYVGSREDIAATLLYRNQWVGMEGAPKTQTFSVHAPLYKRRLGMGLAVMNETIGVSHQLGIYGNVAYRLLFPNSVLSFGLQGGFINDEEKYSELITITQGDNQFANDVRKLFIPNAGFGIYYYKDKFYAGLSVPRLFENRIVPSFSNNETLPTGMIVKNTGNLKTWHYYLTTGCVFDLDEDLKFKPSIMVKAVQHAPVEMDVTVNFLSKDFLWMGFSYRTGDAIAALIGMQISKQFRIGYSYDYTLSKLQKYNGGSHELTLGYDFSFDKKKVISSRYF